MNVLITGGSGFIGSHLADKLVETEHSLLAMDNYVTSSRDTLTELRERLQFVEASIADAEDVDNAFKRFEPEIVIHCAASYKDPDNWIDDARINVLGTINVVKAALRHKVRRIINFQTSLCYGNFPKEQPITLSHPLSPENSYAISKVAGERYIALSGLDFQSFRLANIYGPRNFSGPIPTFYGRLAASKKCFAVNTRRDFVYIDDMIQVVMRALEGHGHTGYYHISSGLDYSIREVYDAVAKAMGINQPVEGRERGPGDAPTLLLDSTETQMDFAWKATTPLNEGIRKTVEWYKQHGVQQTYTHLKMQE